VVVVGGGPSALQFPFDLISPEDRIIWVNMAGFEIKGGRPLGDNIVYIGDSRLMEVVDGARVKHTICGRDIHLARADVGLSSWISVPTQKESWARCWSDGLFDPGNAGVTAINMAEVLGSREVFLVGMDGRPRGERWMPNFHDHYPADWRKNGKFLSRKFANGLGVAAMNSKARVVNLNPDSEYTQFTKEAASKHFHRSLDDRRLEEKARYDALYSGEVRTMRRKPHYGIANHGKWAWRIIEDMRPASVIDVGTGNGAFPRQCIEKGIETVTGVDFSSIVDGKPAFANALNRGNAARDEQVSWLADSAHDLSVRDGEFELLTAFDFFEHLLPDEIDAVLDEFRRVTTKYWLFSIAYTPSHEVLGGNLHPTVKPAAWWAKRFARFGKVHRHSPAIVPATFGPDKYITVRLK